MPVLFVVLEIGAGAGWQARYFADRGYEVQATDIEDPRYTSERVFPITACDGVHLPFPDGHFDVVYSSSVLALMEQFGRKSARFGPRYEASWPDPICPALEGFALYWLPSGTTGCRNAMGRRAMPGRKSTSFLGSAGVPISAAQALGCSA